VVVPEEAEIVRELFQNVAGGSTCYSEARRLNHFGAPSPGWRFRGRPRQHGKRWSGTTISSLLRQPAYGEGRHEVTLSSGEVVSRAVPAIVDFRRAALARAEAQSHRPGLEVLEAALRNATPIIEVKPRRVGGATYQVPVEIRGERRMSLGVRWLVQAARKRSGKSMSEKLAAELVDAMNGLGAAVKRREDTHKMAEANRAFSHFKW